MAVKLVLVSSYINHRAVHVFITWQLSSPRESDPRGTTRSYNVFYDFNLRNHTLSFLQNVTGNTGQLCSVGWDHNKVGILRDKDH